MTFDPGCDNIQLEGINQRKTSAFDLDSDENQLEGIYSDETWSQTQLWRNQAPCQNLTGKAQPYVEAVAYLSRGHPDLVFLSRELLSARGTRDAERGRAAVLEFSEGQVTAVTKTMNPGQLENYCQKARSLPCGRLYILEDIATNFVEVLGSHLRVNPSFFAEQLRATRWENSRKASNPPLHPSMSADGLTFSLRYPEQVRFGDKKFRKLKNIFCDSNVFRRIGVQRMERCYDDVGSIYRKTSFWSRRNSCGAWDALLLVDPAVGSTVFSSKMAEQTPFIAPNLHLYQGGYADFTPWDGWALNDDLTEIREPPPRSSMFDDIIFYWTKRPQFFPGQEWPASAAFYTKKIVLANWVNVLEHVQRSTSVLEYHLEAGRSHEVGKGPLAQSLKDVEYLEDMLGAVYRLKTDCTQLCDWMSSNLAILGISNRLSHPDVKNREDAQDWINVHERLAMWTSRTKDLAALTLGWMSLVESKRSIDEARSSRILVMLGTFFLPLSLISSIFSMGEDFLPGRSKFWIYVASAVTAVVVITVFVLARRAWEGIHGWNRGGERYRTRRGSAVGGDNAWNWDAKWVRDAGHFP